VRILRITAFGCAQYYRARKSGIAKLYLDELPEFSRSAIEVMRQPLEEGTVTMG
jgi:predicted ATPase with chaperone activity